MRRTGSISVVVAAVILTVSTSACVTSPTLLTDLENASLDARVEVLSRLVAANAGNEFKALPRVSIVDAGAMASEYVGEYRPYTDTIYAGVPKDNRDQLLNADAGSVSDFVLGVYFSSSDSVLLNESRFEEVASTAGLSTRKRTQLQLLVIAHELTHALQQQATGAWSKMLSLTDVDSINAYRAVLEGHAVFIQRRVASDLGIGAPFTGLLGSMPEAKEYDNPADRRSGEMLRYSLDFMYRTGEDYVARVAAAGGMEAVWRAVNEQQDFSERWFREIVLRNVFARKPTG